MESSFNQPCAAPEHYVVNTSHICPGMAQCKHSIPHPACSQTGDCLSDIDGLAVSKRLGLKPLFPSLPQTKQLHWHGFLLIVARVFRGVTGFCTQPIYDKIFFLTLNTLMPKAFHFMQMMASKKQQGEVLNNHLVFE